MNLEWAEVDLETSVIIRKVRKNRKRLEIPLNDVAQAWHGMKKCQVFYNPESGDRFKDLWLGLKKAFRKAGLEDVNWHTFHVRNKGQQGRCRYRNP